jgi:hypothetical protein
MGSIVERLVNKIIGANPQFQKAEGRDIRQA